MCHDLITVNKKSLSLRYALDTFHKGKAALNHPLLLEIWEKLEQLIASGEINYFIQGEDDIENPLPVFS